MKQISDLNLLLSVIALPAMLALGMGIGSWGFAEPLSPDLVAMCMMMVLMFSAMGAQSLGTKVLDNGPRAAAQRLGWALGMFGILILRDVPPADMTLGQMVHGWLWLSAIVLVGLSLGALAPLRAMRRHPRGMQVFLRRGAITLAIAAVMAAFFAWMEAATIPQAAWCGMVLLAALSSGEVAFRANRGRRKTRLGKLALALADAIPFAALIVLAHYAAHFGQVKDIGMLPIGTLIGASIVFLVGSFSGSDETVVR